MKNLKLKFYHDAGHGWLAVKRTVLIQLDIIKNISDYSYQSETGSTVYLEEDCDATTLIKALESKGIQYQFEHIEHKNRSRIRSMPRFFEYSKPLTPFFVNGGAK